MKMEKEFKQRETEVTEYYQKKNVKKLILTKTVESHLARKVDILILRI